MSAALAGLAGVALVVVLVAANALFVAGEFALFASRRGRIEGEGSDPASDRGRARRLDRALSRPDRYVAAAQVGAIATTLGLGIVCVTLLAHALGPLVAPIVGDGADRAVGATVGFVVVLVVQGGVGGLLPKALGIQRPRSTALATVGVLGLVAAAGAPLVWLVRRAGARAGRLIGLSDDLRPGVLSEDQLRELVTASHAHGVLEDDERTLISNVFEFTDTRTDQVMVPRPDVLALDIGLPDDEVVAAAAASPHSRIPVYEGDLDHVVGVLHVKDVFGWTLRPAAERPAGSLRALLRIPAYVPETKKVPELLAEFQRKRTHLAVVVDEYGGTAGIVTLEDVLEELVGEIRDEFDPDRQPGDGADDPDAVAERLLPGASVTLEGQLPIEDLNRRFDLRLPDEHFRTVAGWVFGELGRAPAEGDEAVSGDVTFTVAAIEGNRITSLTLRAAEEPEHPDPADGADGASDRGVARV